jgi:hypothetical protein
LNTKEKIKKGMNNIKLTVISYFSTHLPFAIAFNPALPSALVAITRVFLEVEAFAERRK